MTADGKEKRDAIFRFIVRFIAEHGFSPSVRDIGRGVGIASTSTVHYHLSKLAEDGWIELGTGKRRAIRVTAPQAAVPVQVPLVGRVAAGKPILASENIERYVAFPFDRPTTSGDYFALRVRGDSMVDAAILDGDVVIVEKTTTANDGDIVVALIDDEATVKTLKHDASGRAYLHPENPRYDDIPIDREDAMILGAVRGLIRPAF